MHQPERLNWGEVLLFIMMSTKAIMNPLGVVYLFSYKAMKGKNIYTKQVCFVLVGLDVNVDG